MGTLFPLYVAGNEGELGREVERKDVRPRRKEETNECGIEHAAHSPRRGREWLGNHHKCKEKERGMRHGRH